MLGTICMHVASNIHVCHATIFLLYVAAVHAISRKERAVEQLSQFIRDAKIRSVGKIKAMDIAAKFGTMGALRRATPKDLKIPGKKGSIKIYRNNFWLSLQSVRLAWGPSI